MLALLLCLTAFAKSTTEWKDWALLLNADTVDKPTAVRELKNIPDLDQILRSALKGPDQKNALLVIRELKRSQFAEDLFQLVRQEPQWEYVATLNTLLDTAKNRSAVLDHYRSSLRTGKTASPVLLQMLEGLEKKPLLAAECLSILKVASAELQLAVFRHAMAHGIGHKEYLPVLRKGLEIAGLRLAALEWLAREPRKTQATFRETLEYLSLDADDDTNEKAKALLEPLEKSP